MGGGNTEPPSCKGPQSCHVGTRRLLFLELLEFACVTAIELRPRVAAAVQEKHMPMIVGEGEYRYEVFDDWAKLPPDIRLGEVSGVAVDSKDNVFVFNRGPHPVVVFDRDGAFLRTWGQGVFVKPHALHTGPDDTIFCTDDGDHTVRQCTPEGKILLEIGVPGKPSPYMSGTPVPSLHPHRACTGWKPLYFRWIRESLRAQVFARGSSSKLMGRLRYRSWRIQYSA